jgi:hypothetical protein
VRDRRQLRGRGEAGLPLEHAAAGAGAHASVLAWRRG